MANAIWTPRTTVAALCERDGRYLLVRESVNGDIVFNQPAGHLDPDETLLQAVVRETLEETRYQFVPTALQGVYRFKPNPDSDKTYIRFLFRGEVDGSKALSTMASLPPNGSVTKRCRLAAHSIAARWYCNVSRIFAVDRAIL
jgi:8-oxo-dGTP pyrophosphatase MutT (NUDIX family)